MDAPETTAAAHFGFRDKVIASALFGITLGTYWLSTGSELYGDETWYFYLARTFGREPAAAVDHASFHLLNRPLYYAIYHFGTYAGIPGFRWFASAAGALTVALCFCVARALDATRLSAACVSGVLSVERPLVEWGAHGFPDTLASAFALGAIWAAWTRRAGMSFVLATCCVLSKESFVALPLIVIAVRVWPRPQDRLRIDLWAWATLVVPIAYVAFVTLLGRLTPGVAMQGWSSTPMSWKHANSMWVGPQLWPLIGWLAVQRQWRVLGIWLGLPGFYVLWSAVLGHGLSPWYATGPAYLAAVASASAIPTLPLALPPRLDTRRLQLLCAMLLAGLLPIAASGLTRIGKQLRELGGDAREGAAAGPVVSLLQQLQPDRVLLVHCFWSYGYAPLRAVTEPARRIDWPANNDVSAVREAARSAQITIVCRAPATEGQEQALAASLSTLHVDREFLVLR